MRPEIIKELYPSEEILIATVNVKDYEPDTTGREDSVPAIQQAIDDCVSCGGGTVYLPEGRYALKSSLTIRRGVTLRGEWINPDIECNQGRGTVLCCYWGKHDSEGTAQVTMEACTGFVNMTLYYPEQKVGNPIPYSPAVRQNGVDSITLKNVTLVNPWQGVNCGPDANELHYLNNVYMTPLHTGVFMDMTTDIGRMQNLYISPKYWEEFTLFPEEDLMTETVAAELGKYMLSNVTGVFMARSDWEYGYNIQIEGCKIGFMITSRKDSGPNTQISGLKLHNCDTGFKLVNVNPYGAALSDSTITADKEGLTAAIESEGTFQTVMQLNGVDFAGSFLHQVLHKGKGQLSFVNCSFRDWKEGGSAILQENGGLSLLQCTFKGKGLHFEIEDGVTGTQILGCKYEGSVCRKVGEKACKELLYSEEPLYLPVAPRGGHKPYPYKTCPESGKLYLAGDYGAIGDGKTDNTQAFQNALKEAAKEGGIVYVPSGWYRFDGNLTIPSGVELRGAFEVPCHTMGGGSVLQPFGGKGQETAIPFITLESRSGLKGIVLHYPEQDPVNPVKYPWSVQAAGSYCYVINTVFVNSWLGLDLGTYGSENHYVSYISGAPIHCGIYAGNNKEEGWIENIQYNPHYWYRCSLPNKPKGESWRAFWHNQIKYLDALKFGYNEQLHLLGTFVFAARNGLYFVEQDGRGTSGKFIGHGTDGGEKGIYIDGAGNIDFINTELVTIESPETRIYLSTSKNVKGYVKFYNTLMWGAPDYAVVIEGGKVELQQINYVDQGKMANTVRGGMLKLSGGYFYHNTDHLTQDGGEALVVGNMTVKSPGSRKDHNNIMDIKIKGGTTEERWNWSK
ncbi:MAG: glycosyl hydrolase family 28-related protein [Anaerocolumna sp.]